MASSVRAVLALVIAGLIVWTSCGVFGTPPLTVIVISLDTTRPDHLSAYGYDRETTPNLARLAREGAVFTNARSSSSWTLPAHMSLFTGLPPGLHDVIIDFQVLDRGRLTMGEIFEQAGYRTMGVFSAPYVHGRYGFSRGMEFYERGTSEPMLFDLPPGAMAGQLGMREALSHREVSSGLVVDRGVHLLNTSRNEHNLLFLHLFDPHYDFQAPTRHVARFTDAGYRGPVSGDAVMAQSSGDEPVIHAGMPGEDLAHLTGLYDAELAWVDESLGKLLEALEAQGRLDQTLIVVTGDHGEEFFERGRFGHRMGLMDEVLRVPLLIWSPGRVPAGAVVDEDVAVYDVLPTIMDYAGLDPEATLDGRSLRTLLDGETWRPRPTTAALSFFPPEPLGHYVLHQAFVLGDMKVVRRVKVPWSAENERDLGGKPDLDSLEIEVYDLAADPGETIDLHAAGDPRVPALLQAMAAEDARQLDRLYEFQPQGAAVIDVGLPLKEFMEQMGY